MLTPLQYDPSLGRPIVLHGEALLDVHGFETCGAHSSLPHLSGNTVGDLAAFR